MELEKRMAQLRHPVHAYDNQLFSAVPLCNKQLQTLGGTIKVFTLWPVDSLGKLYF